MGWNMADSQLLEGAPELRQRELAEELLFEGRLIARGELEDRMPVGIEGAGYAVGAEDLVEQLQVPDRVFFVAEEPAGLVGRVVDRGQQREGRIERPQPRMRAPVDLQEPAGLRHAGAARAVLRWPAPTGRPQSRRQADPPNGRDAEPKPFVLRQAIPQVVVVVALQRPLRQRHDPLPHLRRQPVRRRPTPIAVRHARHPGFPVPLQQPPDLPHRPLQQPRRLHYRQPTRRQRLQHPLSLDFAHGQCHRGSHGDIIAEPLARTESLNQYRKVLPA